MGWNESGVANREAPGLLRLFDSRPYVYFAHSYYVPEDPEAAAVCTYEPALHGRARSGNVFGVQFHPEKSGPGGPAHREQFRGAV